MKNNFPQYIDDEMLYDDRIYSKNPKDWDSIKDLNIYYTGYFDLPSVYTELRDSLPVKKETLFFLDGFFISAKPNENPADVYIKYLNKKEANKQYYAQWEKLFYEAVSYNLKYRNWEPKIHPKEPNYKKDAVTIAIEKITPIFLMILQKHLAKNKKIEKTDLYSAYKQSICNNKEIENHLSFDRFTSDLFFAKKIANWKYAPKIAHLLKNDYLKAELKNRLHNKIKQNKVSQSAKWYKKYETYKAANKNAKNSEVYNLKMSGFFQDIDSMQSINETENFTILKKDLFNPSSDYNIKALISAAIDKETILHVKENIKISSLDKDYTIAFGYKDNKNTGKMLFANNQKHLPKDASVYSISDKSFSHLAQWQRKLRLKAINQNNGKSR